VALSVVVNPTSREAGGAGIRETTIGGVGKVERQPEITITTIAARTKRRFLRIIAVLLSRAWLKACPLRERAENHFHCAVCTSVHQPARFES
jgi:hypothetical protein